MDGILDADVKAGRLTHEKARRLKEQVRRRQRQCFHVATTIVILIATIVVCCENEGSCDADDGDWKHLFRAFFSCCTFVRVLLLLLLCSFFFFTFFKRFFLSFASRGDIRRFMPEVTTTASATARVATEPSYV